MRSICADLVTWCAATADIPAFAAKVPQLESLPCVLVYRPEEADPHETHSDDVEIDQRVEKFRVEVHSKTALQADALAILLHDALRTHSGLLKAESELELECANSEGLPASDTLTTPDGTDVGCHLCGFPIQLFVKVA